MNTPTKHIAALLVVSLIMFIPQSIIAAAEPQTDITGLEQSFEDSSSPPSQAEVIAGADMTAMLENDRFILYVNPSTGEFNVTDKRNGMVWWSTPPAADEDPRANGRNKMELKSNMLFRYADPATGEIDLTNTFVGSVSNGTVTVSKTEDAVQIAYKMNAYRLYVPLVLTLNEDGFTCSVDTSSIVEGGAYRIYRLSLLPYFGAAGQDDMGYMFVPDGSGAIISFNNQKYNYAQYRQTVYGFDNNFDMVQKKGVTQSIRMPVFGIKKAGGGCLGIITEGSGIAEIEATVSGRNTSYNNVYSSFNLRYIDVYYLGQSLGGSIKPINIFDKKDFRIKRVAVKYVLLSGEDSGYVGMAKAYRKYLAETFGMSKLPSMSPELHIEIIGCIRKTEHILGIPFTVTRVLTDFDKTREILSTLKAEGVDGIALKYTNWEKNAVKGMLTDNASVVGSLGGKKGLVRLSKYAKSEGIPFYLDADFTTVSKFKASFPKSRNAVLNLSKKTVNLYQYSIVNFYKDQLKPPVQLLSPSSAVNAFNKFCNNFEKLGVDGLSLGKTADMLYSDFRDDSFSRDTSAACMAEIARKASEKYSVMLNGGNAYSLPYADRVVGAPGTSSDFDVIDMSVPFYQITLYGYIKTSSSPVNLSSNPRRELLRAIEYLSSLHYCWIGSDMRELINTDYSYLYSADYRTWLEQASEYYKELANVWSKTEGSDIKSHENLADGIYKVTWENGLEIILNYNSKEVEVEGHHIPKENYIILGKAPS